MKPRWKPRGAERDLAWLAGAALLIGAAAACRSVPSGSEPAVSWHRFPITLATRVEPALAVIYSSDGIGPATTLARLGYPDRMLFRLHRDHPALKVALTSCPANRYSGARSLADSPESTSCWRSLALDPEFEWIDLAGQGYNHSPPGDTNLNHHEFSTRQTGCNLDHRDLDEPEYCTRQMTLARQAYRAAGIPDGRVVIMRFPGMEHSPQALKAALEAGFLAVMDSGHDDRPGGEWWTALPDDGEILMLRNSNVLKLFARSEELEAGLAQGRISAGQVADRPEFLAAVGKGIAYVEKVEATGGVLNLMDQWWETFKEIGGAAPRYLVVDAVLREIEARYGPRVWYPTSRELVLWLDARRNARLLIEVEPPERWRTMGLEGLEEASARVTLPPDSSGIAGIEIKEAAGEWRPLAPGRWWRERDGAVVLFPLRGAVKLRLRLTRG